MRVISSVVAVAVAALLATPEFAAAQRQPPLPPPPVSVPPPISTSPGPASLGVPHPIPPMSTSPGSPRDLFQQVTPSGPRDLFRQLTPPFPQSLFVPQGFVFGPSSYAPMGYTQVAGSAPAGVPIARGWLRFETTPGSAQVFVDGYYVGVADDFGISGRALELEAGPHRIELRAPGYAILAFDVNIVANQATRYRGDLQRLAAIAPPPPTVPAAPRTTYVIPNCYAGDRPPTRPLPRGCDVRQMRTTSH